jgi:predicted secreted protein
MWNSPERGYLEKRGYITPSPAPEDISPREQRLMDIHGEVLGALQQLKA